MRQDLLGAAFVASVCGVVVLATYRPEKNESRIRIFVVLFLAMLFAFVLSFAILLAFFSYTYKASAEMNIIKAPPDF